MDILDFFFKKAFFDDPWISLTTSLAVLAGVWVASWFLWCVIGYQFYFVPLGFPEDPDIAYLVGHVFALLTTTVAGWFLLRHYFGIASYTLGPVLPLLWIVFKILRINALSRKGEPAAGAAAAAGR